MNPSNVMNALVLRRESAVTFTNALFGEIFQSDSLLRLMPVKLSDFSSSRPMDCRSLATLGNFVTIVALLILMKFWNSRKIEPFVVTPEPDGPAGVERLPVIVRFSEEIFLCPVFIYSYGI